MLMNKYQVFACGRPLKVGVAADLQTALPEISASLLVAAIRLHTNTPSYQRSLIDGGPRYDLHGNIAAEVERGQIAHARVTLTKIEDSLRERRADKAEAKPAGEEMAVTTAPSLDATKPAATPKPAPATTKMPTESRRLSLGDLREAARRRRVMEEAT
jgi:sRNA-binding protein